MRQKNRAVAADYYCRPTTTVNGCGRIFQARAVSVWRHPLTKGNRVGHHALDRREGARHAAGHVVLLAVLLQDVLGLAADLQEANDAEDLHLGGGGEGIPLVGRAARRRDVAEGRAREGLRPRPVDAVRLHDEANEGSHGDAAVLDLGLAQEANGGLLADGELPDWEATERCVRPGRAQSGCRHREEHSCSEQGRGTWS